MVHIILYWKTKKYKYTQEWTIRKLCLIIVLMDSILWRWCIGLMISVISSLWLWRLVIKMGREWRYCCRFLIGKLVRFMLRICIGAIMFLFQRKSIMKNKQFILISLQMIKNRAHGFYKVNGIINGGILTKIHTSEVLIVNWQNNR